jgi:hypothetical protein
MVNSLRIALPWIGPGLHYFENEQIVLFHQTAIDHFAFEIGETFSDQGRSYAPGLQRRYAELLELRKVAA